MNKFWIGWCLCFCFQMGVQQIIGKEKYIMAINILWTTEPWWTWLLIAGVVCFVGLVDQWINKKEGNWRP